MFLVYKWCIDGIFGLFKNKQTLQLFMNYMNYKYRNIIFTFALKITTFLDVEITCPWQY